MLQSRILSQVYILASALSNIRLNHPPVSELLHLKVTTGEQVTKIGFQQALHRRMLDHPLGEHHMIFLFDLHGFTEQTYVVLENILLIDGGATNIPLRK